HASKVTIIHRRDDFRAERVLKDRLLAHPKITVMWDSVVDEVVGTDEPPAVTAVKVRNVKSGAITEVPTDGLFVAIGHTPATQIFKGKVRTDAEGYVVTAPDSTATDIPGVFAAGDVKDKVYRQAVTAAGLG